MARDRGASSGLPLECRRHPSYRGGAPALAPPRRRSPSRLAEVRADADQTLIPGPLWSALRPPSPNATTDDSRPHEPIFSCPASPAILTTAPVCWSIGPAGKAPNSQTYSAPCTVAKPLRRYEFCDLFGYFFGPTAFKLVLAPFVLCNASQAVSAIIATAQVWPLSCHCTSPIPCPLSTALIISALGLSASGGGPAACLCARPFLRNQRAAGLAVAPSL